MSLSIDADERDAETGERLYSRAFGLTVGRRFGKDFVELLGWEAPVYHLAMNAGTVGAATSGTGRQSMSMSWSTTSMSQSRGRLQPGRARSAGQGHALRSHRRAWRSVRPRLLPAAVQRAGYDALLEA